MLGISVETKKEKKMMTTTHVALLRSVILYFLLYKMFFDFPMLKKEEWESASF